MHKSLSYPWWNLWPQGSISMVLHLCQAALLGGHFIRTRFALPKARTLPFLPWGCALAKITLHVQTCLEEACGGCKTCHSLISCSQKRDFNFLAESFCLERSQAPTSWEPALAVKSAKGCSMGWQILFLIFFNDILLYNGIFFKVK